MNNKRRNKIIAGLLTLGLVISPLTVEARGGGGHAGGHASSHASSHVSSHSSSHVSSSHSSSRSVSSFKSSSSVKSTTTSKPTSKSTTKSTVKPSTKTATKSTVKKADSGKFTTKPQTKTQTKSNKSTVKSNTTKNTTTKTTKTTVRKVTINKNYKVKPKTTTRVVVSHPTRYVHYSSSPIYVNRGASFWDYYMLSTLINNNNNHQVTERDIAQNLEQQGYSQSEVDQILKDAQTENKKVKRDSFFKKILDALWFAFKSVVFISALVIVIMWLRKRFR